MPGFSIRRNIVEKLIQQVSKTSIAEVMFSDTPAFAAMILMVCLTTACSLHLAPKQDWQKNVTQTLSWFAVFIGGCLTAYAPGPNLPIITTACTAVFLPAFMLCIRLLKILFSNQEKKS